LKILAVGAHPDDVELGCAGTLALHKRKGHQVYVLVLTRGEASGDAAIREDECRAAAATIGVDQLFFGNLHDTRIADGIDTIMTIEKVIKTVAPDIVFSHTSKDAHQDHRNTGLASLSAARNISNVFLYECPAALRGAYGNAFTPQVFVDIAPVMNVKLKAIAAFNSQASKAYMNQKPIVSDPCAKCSNHTTLSSASASLARFRGFQAGLGLAEAFEVAKYIFQVEAP
jgi:LmbE family N-acetylglucosaminyl deacetylase